MRPQEQQNRREGVQEIHDKDEGRGYQGKRKGRFAATVSTCREGYTPTAILRPATTASRHHLAGEVERVGPGKGWHRGRCRSHSGLDPDFIN
ncbi:hypothetical protein E2C01_028911 [Portunus trituberculatus]|uniref:Uncharacterized protein n=1 Tax=Portunus trituberculatus TaxID=210409 RepID=A0A5B7EQE6_PORTR|nr:hypothetical protein [Portunus trituberculatus]